MRWWRERRQERREQQEQAERTEWLNRVLARARDGEGRTVSEILQAASQAMDVEARVRRPGVARVGRVSGFYGDRP